MPVSGNGCSVLLGDDAGHQALLAGVAAEDVGEAGGEDHLEAVVLEGPHGVLARGAGAEVGDLAAEKSILSAMLLSQDVLQECLVHLEETDFYLHSHRTVFNAMKEMFDRGRPVDPISLSDHLRSAGSLERIGGMAFLLEDIRMGEPG